MRNILTLSALTLTVAAFATFAGCGDRACQNSTAPSESTTNVGEQASESDASGETAPNDAVGKALVVYFSRTGEQYSVGKIDKGNTAIVAEIIAKQTGASLWEVVPEKDEYPKDDYDKLTDVAKEELNKGVRPAYVGEAPDLSEYDTIFFGAPVWWGDWPTIMYTFYEKNRDALANKTLVPFSTHEGSGLSGFDQKLAAACPKSKVTDGLAIKGTDAQKNQDKVESSVKSWLAKLGF